MKILKRKIVSIYIISFTIIACIFGIIFIKLKVLENVKLTEKDEIAKYRTTCLLFEENYDDVMSTDDLVDITNLQSTLSGMAKKMISGEVYCSNLVEETEYNKEITPSESKEEITPSGATEVQIQQEIDCILKIPSINLEKPIYNKNTTTYLEKYYLVTAYDNMNFKEGGTYIIYGHNSYVENVSFQKLPRIKLNDTVIIEYQNKDYEFVVTEIQTANTEQISDYFIQAENKIVLVACTNQSTKTNPEYLVVVANS